METSKLFQLQHINSKIKNWGRDFVFTTRSNMISNKSLKDMSFFFVKDEEKDEKS